MGSLYCYDGQYRCGGAGGDTGHSHPCYIHNIWSGTAGGRGYYILYNYVAIRTDISDPLNYAISARCVRYLIKMCLLYRVNFKKTLWLGLHHLWVDYMWLRHAALPRCIWQQMPRSWTLESKHRRQRLLYLSPWPRRSSRTYPGAKLCLFGSLCPEVKRNCVYSRQ